MAFTAGQKVRASELNEITAGPIFSGITEDAAVLSDRTWSSLFLSGEIIDTHNGHSTFTNNSRWYCPADWPGYYEVSGGTYISGSSAGTYRACRMAVSGVGVARSQKNLGPVDEVSVDMFPTIVFLGAGDYVELQANQNSFQNMFTLAAQTVFNVKFLRR